MIRWCVLLWLMMNLQTGYQIQTQYHKWLADNGITVPERPSKLDFNGTFSVYRSGRRPNPNYPEMDSIIWRRPARPRGVAPRLWLKGATSGDPKQGKLGDCWLLGAMSLIATRDDLLYKVFYHHEYAGPMPEDYGIYVLRFFKGRGPLSCLTSPPTWRSGPFRRQPLIPVMSTLV